VGQFAGFGVDQRVVCSDGGSCCGKGLFALGFVEGIDVGLGDLVRAQAAGDFYGLFGKAVVSVDLDVEHVRDLGSGLDSAKCYDASDVTGQVGRIGDHGLWGRIGLVLGGGSRSGFGYRGGSIGSVDATGEQHRDEEQE
jgi:hypothetical protein